jgi:hypothetical protein
MGALSNEAGTGPAGLRCEWGPTHGRGRHYVVPESQVRVPVVPVKPFALLDAHTIPIPPEARTFYYNRPADDSPRWRRHDAPRAR